MNEKQICADLRHEFGKVGLALLVYYGIMNAMVMLVAFVDAITIIVKSILSSTSDTVPDTMIETALEGILSNGLGYILAIAIGCVIMLLWKKKQFCFVDIWITKGSMTTGSFAALLCVFISGQALFQILAGIMEWFFNLFDMSVLDAMKSASVTGDNLSMFLYITLFAPIFEEILFRGLILRTLEPYGKKFAILASAFLFGIFHGNIVQSPYAFVVGLVLGYVAVEFSIGWAMVLHMINNLVLGDSLTRIAQLFPVWAGDLIFFVIIWGCTLAAIIVMIARRKQISAYVKTGRIHPWCLKSFFTSPAILVLTGIMGINILMTMLLQLLA